MNYGKRLNLDLVGKPELALEPKTLRFLLLIS